MIKKHFRAFAVRLMILLTAALTLGSMATLFAAAAKDKQFVLNQERDIEISVLYKDSTEPTVSVSGPGGKNYTKDADYSKVERATGVLNLYIKKAAAGSWKVNASADVTISVLSWNEPMTVASFTNEAPKNGQVKVSALVKSAENLRYDWEIYAIPDFATTGLRDRQVLLRETSGNTNENAATEVDVSKLPDGNWTLSMTAYYTNPDETEVETSASAAKPFTVSGHNKAGEQKEFITVTDLSEETVEINWDGVQASYDTMLVSVAAEDGTPVFYSDFERDVKSARIVRNDQVTGDLTLRLMPMRNDTFETIYTRKLTFSPGISLSIDTDEATSALMATISYSVGDKELPMIVAMGDSELPVNINTQEKEKPTGEEKKDSVKRYRVKGDSSISVALEAMENNNLTARVYVNDCEAYQVKKTIGVQSDPPLLELYGVSDRMVSKSDTFRVSGKTDPDSKLTLNGEEVELNDDGTFTAEAKLENGDNSLAFTAENTFGVKTTRTINVNRTDGDVANASSKPVGIGSVLPVIVGGIFALMCAGAVVLTVFLTKKRGKKLPFMIINAFIAFIGMLAVGFAGATVYCHYMKGVENSAISDDKLVDLLESEKYQAINEGLDKVQIWESRANTMMVFAIVAASVFVLALAGVIIFGVLRRKNGKQPPQPPVGGNQQQWPQAPREPQPPQHPQQPQQPRIPQQPQQPQNPQHPWRTPPNNNPYQ